MIKRAILILILILIVLLLVACGPNERAIVWPTESWPVSSPEDQGLDAALLDKSLQEFASGAYGYVNRFLLIRNGHVVIDENIDETSHITILWS